MVYVENLLFHFHFREFTQLEIEHFIDPCDKDHPKFDNIADLEVLLFSVSNQMGGKSAVKTTFGKAVADVSMHFIQYFWFLVPCQMHRLQHAPARLHWLQPFFVAIASLH